MILKESMPCVWGPRSNGEPGGEQTLLLVATHVLLLPHPRCTMLFCAPLLRLRKSDGTGMFSHLSVL